ncbi:MAG: copper homeostasis protein CutC [Allorhizobium sp.]
MTVHKSATERKTVLEVCVDDAAGLAVAIAGGADRIELCSALSVGGLTPTVGFMSLAGTSAVPVHALIRPRPGDFVFSPAEVDIARRDINAAGQAGLAGVVIGASLGDGRLDEDTLGILVDEAAGLDLTLHRAFDLVPDQLAALEAAIGLGFNRILTSGGSRTALDGLATLAAVASAAGNRISIMPGGGLRPETVAQFLALPGLLELHASCARPAKTADPVLVDLGFLAAESRRTDLDTVRAFRAAMDRG